MGSCWDKPFKEMWIWMHYSERMTLIPSAGLIQQPLQQIHPEAGMMESIVDKRPAAQVRAAAQAEVPVDKLQAVRSRAVG